MSFNNLLFDKMDYNNFIRTDTGIGQGNNKVLQKGTTSTYPLIMYPPVDKK